MTNDDNLMYITIKQKNQEEIFMLHPVLAMAIGIAIMMLLIIFTKMHAFPSLIISAILIAVLAMPFGPEGAIVDEWACFHDNAGLRFTNSEAAL